MGDVRPFYETIVRHVLAAVSMTIYEDDLERAKARIWSDNVNLMFNPEDEGRVLVKKFLVNHLYELMIDPSIVALQTTGEPRRFANTLAANRDRIEFYFDHDTDAPWVTEWWEKFIAPKEFDTEIYGTHSPRFEDDEEYLPLQAADFWAWWVRHAEEEGGDVKGIARGDFGSWQGPKGPPMLFMGANEDALAEFFVQEFLKGVPALSIANIYDEKKKPRSEHAQSVFHAKKRSKMLSYYEQLLRRIRRRR